MRSLPNVIKTSEIGGSSRGHGHSQADKIIIQAQLKADDIIHEADEYRKKAEQDIKAAELETQEIRQKIYAESRVAGLEKGTEQGREIGFKQGYQDAVAKVTQQIGDLIDRFEDSVEMLNNARNSVIERQQRDLPDIAVAISETIIGKKIQDDAGTIEAMIETALESYRNEEWINIYLSKDIYDRINEQKKDFFERIKSISAGARIYSCRDFDDSDCVIELKEEIVDISVDSQLRKVKNALRK